VVEEGLREEAEVDLLQEEEAARLVVDPEAGEAALLHAVATDLLHEGEVPLVVVGVVVLVEDVVDTKILDIFPLIG